MQNPPVCDYEGSDYQTRFWQNQGRGYEDLAERIALQALMPASGTTLIDIGAGFGRLANEFDEYKRIVLFDYSRSLLREAQERLGHDDRFYFVAGNWYEMPFVPGLFQTLVQVRTIHHAANVPALFTELARIAQPKAHYILEFANKHNLKAMLRYTTGKQRWSPYNLQPIEFVKLNYNFHPTWILEQLQAAGFMVQAKRSVSNFRLNILKKWMPAKLLLYMEKGGQPLGKWLQISPSIFTQSISTAHTTLAQENPFFACPTCKHPLSTLQEDKFKCSCGNQWAVENNFFDFKEPIL